MNKNIVILILISLFSCKEKEYDYTYYEDGELHEKIELNNDSIAHGEYLSYHPSGELKVMVQIENGLMQGIRTFYHENGNINMINTMKDDKLNGLALGYYENGNIAFKENYKNDLHYGKQLRYFELDSGKIREKADCLIVKGKVILTRLRIYNEKGDIIEKSRYIKIDSQTDTLSLGDTSTIQIEMIDAKYNRMSVSLANYDEQFYLDSVTLDTIPARNHIAKIPIIAEDTGVQYLRGYVNDYELHDTDSAWVSVVNISAYNYFEYEYYVLPK